MWYIIVVQEGQVAFAYVFLHFLLCAFHKEKVGDQGNLLVLDFAVVHIGLVLQWEEGVDAFRLQEDLGLHFLSVGSPHQKPNRLFGIVCRRGGLDIIGGHPCLLQTGGRSIFFTTAIGRVLSWFESFKQSDFLHVIKHFANSLKDINR